MSNPMGESNDGILRLDFDRRLTLQFRGSVITSDAGLLAYRELDDALGLSTMAGEMLADTRTGRNGRHALVGLLRQSVFGRLAGYEDVNDAERLLHDPARACIRPARRFWTGSWSAPLFVALSNILASQARDGGSWASWPRGSLLLAVNCDNQPWKAPDNGKVVLAARCVELQSLSIWKSACPQPSQRTAACSSGKSGLRRSQSNPRPAQTTSPAVRADAVTPHAVSTAAILVEYPRMMARLVKLNVP